MFCFTATFSAITLPPFLYYRNERSYWFGIWKMMLVQLILFTILSHQLYSYSFDSVYDKIVSFAFLNLTEKNENLTTKYLCWYNSTAKCCSCEEKCRFQGTCCIDAFLDSNEKSFERYLQYFQNKVGIADDIQYRPIIDIYGSYYIDRSFIVMTCKDKSSLYFTQCNNNLDKNEYKIRVRGLDGVIYRNKFCALCHKVTNYTYLNYVFHDCRYNFATSLFDRTYCHLSIFNQSDPFKVSTMRFMKYIKHNVDSNFLHCNSYEKNLCHNSYLALGRIDHGLYLPNPYCAKCLEKTQIFSSEACEQELSEVESLTVQKAPISSQIIVSFDNQANPAFRYNTRFEFCEDGYQYEIFKDRCIKNYFVNNRNEEQSNKQFQLIQKIYEEMINFSFPYNHLEAKDSILDRYFCVYQFSWKCCNCEENCRFYGTCCIDAFFNSNEKSFERYFQYFQNKVQIAKYIEYRPIIDIYGSYDIDLSLIVMTCRDTSSLYFSQCKKNLDKNEYKIRVRGADGVIYRNKFCALCSNVTNYTYLTYVFHSCEYNSYTSLFDTRQKCRLSIFSKADPSKRHIISFMKNIKADMYKFNPLFLNCNYRERNLCQNSYLAFGKIDDGHFVLNPHCAKCLRKIRSFSSEGCEIFARVNSITYYIPPINPQIIVSFDDDANPVFQYKTNFRFCEDGYQYEVFKGKCIKKYFLKVRPKEQSNNRYQLIKEIYGIMIPFSFPYSKLESKDSVLDRYFCVYQSSSKCCSCSKYCNIHGTCCIDAFFDRHFDSFTEYLRFFKQKTAIKSYIEVLPVIENSRLVFSNILNNKKCDVDKMPIFTKCVNVNSEFYKMCNDTDNNNTEYLIRVTGSDGIMYRNKYCALCNNVTSHEDAQYLLSYYREHVFLNIYNYLANNQNNTNTILHQKYCRISLAMSVPQDLGALMFSKELYYPNETEMNCSSYEKDMCLNSFLGIVQVPEGRYRGHFPNWFCTKCLKIAFHYANHRCSEVTLRYLLDRDPDELKKPQPVRTLIKLVPESPAFRKIIECSKGFMYDKQLDACIPLHRINLPYHKLGFILLWETWNIQSKLLHCLFKLNGSLWFLAQNFTFPSNDSIFNEKDNKNLGYHVIKIPFNNFEDMNKVFRINKTKNSSKIYASFQPNNFIRSLYGFIPGFYFFQNRVCASINLLENYDLTQNCDVVYKNNTFSIMENVTYWLEMLHNSTTAYAAFCTKFLRSPNCALIKTDKSLITINETKVYVRDNEGYNVVKTEEYIPLPDGIATCIKMSKKHIFKWYKTLVKYENALAIFCLFLSIVMETILIVTYIKLRELRTLHGKNLLSLSSSLFVCDVIMLFLLLSSDIPQNICQFTAVILHFFAMALSVWAGVMAFDLWSAFNVLSSTKTGQSIFFKYSMVGWGVPAIVLLLCLSLEHLSKEMIQYGRNGQCFIENTLAKLFSYILPTILIMIISSILMLVMIRKLRRELRSRSKVTAVNNTSPNLIHLSLKLCLALGIAELLGVIQIPSSNQREVIVIINSVFGCLYTLMRSLRGCFIFVSFMITKKMKRYFRCFFIWKKHSNRESFHLSTVKTTINLTVGEEVKH